MIHQILLNLAANARDAMPLGGQFILSTSCHSASELIIPKHIAQPAADYIRLQAQDSGCGMSQEVMTRIFEPFFTTKEAGKGTGLGCANIFNIVNQHKGWIEVKSEVGQGTCFFIYFPRITDTLRVKSLTDLNIKPGQGERILVVEDHETLRSMAVRTLSSYNYQAVSAADAQEALLVWEQHHGAFDLLFTDIILPGSMNGYVLARELLTKNVDLKVLLTTGYPDQRTPEDLTKNPNVHNLLKPYDRLHLLNFISSILNPAKSPDK